MGSIDNPSNTNFPQYNGYRDCSQGICSIYCPQWCYIMFPPPPPSEFDDDSGTNFSPLIIAVIGILASAFLLVSYYTIVAKYCKRRRENQLSPSLESELNQNQLSGRDQCQLATAGLDDSLIKSITVCKYRKDDGLIEGTDCAVCLSEFEEGENLRLMPKCNHAFHLPCIDTWLRSHSNCPLCRSNATPGNPIPFRRPTESQMTSSNFNISSLEFHRRNDLILVVEERDGPSPRDEVVVNIVGCEILPKYPFQEVECGVDGMMIPMDRGIGEGGVQEIRRSTSSGSLSCQNPNPLIADILRIEEEYDDYHVQVGSSNGENSKSNKRSSSSSSNAMKRSVSTGRFLFTRNDKGKNSIHPN